MLEAKAIGVRVGGREVLRDCSLSLDEGELVALIGPSGGGKSTLVRAIAMVDQPTSGLVLLDGVPAIGAREGRPTPWPSVTMVFQQLFLWPHLTLRQNITLPLECAGRESDDGRAAALVDRFDLTEHINKYPNQTSLGQRQRAAIIRALALRPRFLLLDEITSALDVEQVRNVMEVLDEVRGEGTGILLVTHLLGIVHRVAQRVAFLDDGRIVEEGSVDLLDRPKSERVRRFMSVMKA